MANIERIPYADPQKVKGLPAEAQTILGYVKDKMPKKAYKVLEHEFISISENRTGPTLSEKTTYGGALQYTNLIYSEIGAYNPDQIPIQIYERMSKDPTIALGLAVIKYTLAGLTWRIDCDDEVQNKFLTKAVKQIYRQTIVDLSDAVRLGMAMGEKVWSLVDFKVYDDAGSSRKKRKVVFDNQAFILDKVKFVHPKTVRIRTDSKGNFLGVTQTNPINGIMVKVNAKKLVLYSHNMYFGNFFGESRLKNCYPAWYWSSILTQFMLKYYERRGQPLTVVKAPPGSSTDVTGAKVDNLSHALKIGQGAIGNSVVALPMVIDKDHGKEMWTYETVKDDQRGVMFIDILNYFDTRKLRGLFVPDKMGLAADGSPHSSSGSSAGDTLDVFIMTEQALASDIEDVFDKQIIPDLQSFNFDLDVIEDASLKIEKLDYNKKLLMKDVFLRMIMFAAGNVRDGRLPKDLPSLAKLGDMLDLPMDKFKDMFEDTILIPQGPSVVPSNGKGNIQNNPAPTIDKKIIQDKNNQDKSRKERSTRDRSIREKK